MTAAQLAILLALRPDLAACPACGGAGELPLPVGGKTIACTACGGAGVVPAGAAR